MSDRLTVKISFDGKEMEVRGDTEEVGRFFLKFLYEHYPAFKVISDLTLTVDLEALMEKLKGVFAISEGEVIILIPKDELSDREYILLLLLKVYLENALGFIEGRDIRMKKITSISGESSSTISGRLSELVSDGLVKRVERGSYRITPLGIKEVMEGIIPELTAMEGGR